ACEKAVRGPARRRECQREHSRWRRSRATRASPWGWIRDGQTLRERRPTTSPPSRVAPDNRLPHRPPAQDSRESMPETRRTSELHLLRLWSRVSGDSAAQYACPSHIGQDPCPACRRSPVRHAHPELPLLPPQRARRPPRTPPWATRQCPPPPAPLRATGIVPTGRARCLRRSCNPATVRCEKIR